MNAPFFTVEDKLHFLEVIKDINGHIHQVKQHDKTKDVDNLLDDFQDKMKSIHKELSEIGKLLGIVIDEELVKNIIIEFRSAIPERSQVEKAQVKIFEGISKRKRDKLGSTAEEVRNLLREVKRHRQDLKNLMDIVFYKLREIQKGRGLYFKLVRQRLKPVNERINLAKYKIRKHTQQIEDLFESNRANQLLKFKDLEQQGAVKTYIDFIHLLFTELIKLKQALNDLNLERNQFKSIVPHYPGFRDVLQKNTSNDIRRIFYPSSKEKPNYERIAKNVDFLAARKIKHRKKGSHKKSKIDFSQYKNLSQDLNIKSFAQPLEHILDQGLPSAVSEDKEQKIRYRALRILHNLTEGEDAIQELKAKLEKHDISFGTLEELEEIMAKIFENDGQDRIKYTKNWKINLFFEEASFTQLLEDVSIEKITEKHLNIQINSPSTLEEFDPIESNAKHFLKLLIGQLQNDLEEDSLNERLERLKRFYVHYKYSTVPEIEYFVHCSKAHAKWFNNRVYGDEPTLYKPFRIRNEIVQDQLSDRELKFSSKFRRIVQRFDKYIEKYFFSDIASNNFERFNSYCRNHIVLKLKELVISRYAVLNEYLHSPRFTKLTDKVQIYGGAFGIWDNEENRIVRLQSNNYIEAQYRVNEDLAHRSSWYDLPERTLGEKGWQANNYATEISLMFLSERQYDSEPEFYKNLNTPDNMLNIIEKENNCIFIEDGELGAFTLLYRILNGIFHSSIQFNNTKFTAKTALSCNNKVSEIIKVLALKQPPNLATLEEKESVYSLAIPHTSQYIVEKTQTKATKDSTEGAKSISITDRRALRKWSAFVSSKKDLKNYFLTTPKNKERVMLYDIYLEINFRLTLCQQVILLPEERAKVFELHKKEQDSPEFKCGNDRYSKFLSSYYGLMKALLRDFLDALFKLDGERSGAFKLHFRPKKLNSNINEIAFENSEIRAGKERFYNTRESRIPLEANDIMTELVSQGLVYQPQTTTKSDEELIKVTERYVNLCKFIEHEFGTDHASSKLKSNFKREHLTPINDESYFIDKRLAKLKDQYKAAHQTRVLEIQKTRSSIRRIVEGGFNPGRIERSKLFNQLTNILLVLFESMELYFARDKEFLRSYDDQKKDKQHSITAPSFRELPDYMWPKVKEQIDRITKFPIAANFFWRAGGKFAQSQLIIPIASTVTKKSYNNVGFLVLGIRNVYEIAPGQFIHITLNNKLQFKELLYTLRAIFQPLMTPYLDSIYYDKIVKQTAVNSAIEAGASRVMSRNLSHNIGSHVIESIASEEKFKQYFEKESNEENRLQVIAEYTSKLLRHIEERMDIIADMATGSPKFLYPESICDFLHDFQENPILLDHISGIKNKTRKHISITYSSIDKNQRLALPHAWLGIQAFYVIIENIIRNAFKHTAADFNKLTLNIMVVEPRNAPENHELLQVKISPRFTGGDQLDKKEIERSQKNIQKNINQSILDTETNKLRLGNWGILEMKIAAAYLRGIEIHTIDQKGHKPAILSTSINSANAEAPLLEYNFFLEKPKEILVIGSAQKRRLSFESTLRKMGLRIVRPKSIVEAELRENLKYKEANYEFIVVCDRGYWKDLATATDVQSEDSPVQRIVFDDSNEFENQLLEEGKLFSKNKKEWKKDKTKLESFQKIVWQKWIKKLELPKGVQNRIVFLTKKVDENAYKQNEALIVFDSHGRNFDFFHKQQNKPYFYHPFYAANNFIHLYRKKSCQHNKEECVFLSSLAEAAFVDIMIIDERVQKSAMEPYEGHRNSVSPPASFSKVLESAGVIVPDPSDENGLDLQKRENIKEESFTRWIRAYQPKDKKKLRFIIIHYALVEFISKGDVLAQIKSLQRIIADKEWNAQLIFVSGRGYPQMLPKNSYFINYSTLYHYLFSPFCKLSLVRVLYSLRMGNTG